MKILGFIALALLISGCSSLMNLIPDRFDNVEYAHLVSLNVDAEVSKESCAVDIETYKSALFLKKYSEGTMNKTNNEIYSEIESLVAELYNRKDPSLVYCKLKWKNVIEATDAAIVLSGKRIKK